jgi:RIO-like serine/threonine protein kinase
MERYRSRPDAYFVKSNVEKHEIFMHKYIYNLKIDGLHIPRAVMYNKTTREFVMANIDGMSVSDMYGDKIEDVPDDVFEKIREIMVKLVDHGIEYPDFTGYNFILDNNVPNKIWVIDFEHAMIADCTDNDFIMGVYSGAKTWNDEYK